MKNSKWRVGNLPTRIRHAALVLRTRQIIGVLMGAGISICASATDVAPPFVAGLAPWQRPAGAPVITAVQDQDKIKADGLRGVEGTPPKNLVFLEQQGAWYTPFTHPGMLGPYDLRGWHRPAPAANAKNAK